MSADTLDLRQIRADRAKLVQLLEGAGAAFRGNACRCVLDHEDKDPSAGVYQKDGAWKYKCQSCGFNGDYVDVKAKLDGRSVEDVLREMRAGINGNGHVAKNGKPKTPANTPPVNWGAMADRLRHKLTAETLEALASSTGLPPWAWESVSPGWADDGDLRTLRAGGAGWADDRPAGTWAIAEHGGDGAIVGLSLRAEDGRKGFPSGAQRGVVIPAGLDDMPGTVLDVEGASDVVASYALGIPAVGRPSNRGGAAEIEQLLRHREILIVGENDQKPDGTWPGRDGAIAVAQRLANSWGKPVRWTMPPAPEKDIRAWFCSQAAADLDRETLRSYGAELLDALQQAAVEVQPEQSAPVEAPTVKDVWGDPIPLEPTPPPPLPDGILTGWAGDMIYATAEALEAPPELPLTFHLAGLATAVQGRFCVRPETGYFESLAFWAATALPPATRKTAAMVGVNDWMFRWERAKASAAEPIIAEMKRNDALMRGRIKAMQAKAKKLSDETEFALLKQEIAKAEGQLLPIPVAPRLHVEDVTPEHLATLLVAHKERLGIFSDEGGFLDNWAGRYANGVVNIDLLLKAHSGSPCTQDRGCREPAHLRHPLLSIGLAPQPSVVAALVNNPTYRRRGLPARFFFFLPTSRLGFRTLESRPVSEDIAQQYADRMSALAEMEGNRDSDGSHSPRPLLLSADAWRHWKDFSREVEHMLRPDGALGTMPDWGGKLAGATARLAGLFHLEDVGTEAITRDEIGIDPMRRAVLLSRFAIPHAQAVFNGMDASGDMEAARRIWKEAASEQRRQERPDPTEVTSRDLWMPVRGTFKKVQEIEGALRLLIDHNYLCELPNAELGKPGRPSRRFRVNPALSAEW